MSDDKVLSAIDLAESECRAWLGEVAVNGSVSGAANARMHRMFQAIRDSLVERAGEPVAWIAGYMQGANDHADCALDQVELRDDAMRGWEHEATQRATAPGASHE